MKAIRSKVRGISNYQEHAQKCKKDTLLKLIRQPNNKHDKNAIIVCRKGWIRSYAVGYLSADLAKKIAPNMDKGEDVYAIITDVTGGEDQYIGLNIALVF